jgi:hypothetical protein
MGKLLKRAREAFVDNRKALLWIFVTYIPAGMGAGYLGFWLFHTWVLGFVVSGAYILALMFVWGRMLMYMRDSE